MSMQSLLPILGGVSRAAEVVLQQPAHVSITCLVIFWQQFDEYSSFVLDRGSTPFARQPVPPLFLHVCPWRPPTAQLPAPPAASTRAALVLRVSCVFLRDLAPTLGFRGSPSSVSAHSVSMGLTQARLTGDSRVHLVGDECTPPSSRHALAHSSGSSHPPLVSSQCQPLPQAEQCPSWCVSFSMSSCT